MRKPGPKSKTDEQMKEFLLSKRNFSIPVNADSCWIWIGSTDHGYGHIKFRQITWRVHRLAFKLFRADEYVDGLNILHKNECSSRLCFNPNHLYSGSQRDNIQDTVEAGTHRNARQQTCPQGHYYNEENTYVNPNNGKRRCKICHNEDSKFRYFTKGVI